MGSGRFLRTVALGLVVSLVLGGVGPGAVEGAAAADGGRVPVILVHGATGGGPAVWGDRRPEGRGLYARLLKAGYVPGRTLFVYDYGEAQAADYAVLAGTGLEPAVRKAQSDAQAARVDVVTFGSGALVARYWVVTRRGGAPIRNLVMVAPPNHGMPQADGLKVLYHTDRIIRAWGTGAGAASGTGGADGTEFAGPQKFVSENQYVAERARAYRSLYREYVLEARLLGGDGGDDAGDDDLTGGGRGAPPPGYEEWIVGERPEIAEKYVFGAQRLPNPPGLGLTLAYYEMLSLRVGRQLYLAGAVETGRPLPLPSLEDLLTPMWREQITAYLRDLVLTWGLDKAKVLWARLRPGVGVSLGEFLASLAPGEAAMSRLVPEHLAFPGPQGAPCETAPGAKAVLCNGFLGGWQDREAPARPADSRYVTIVGACPGPLGLLGLRLGPNDLVVEAASALTAPLPADDFRLERGVSWAHALLPKNGKVMARVLEALGGGRVEAAEGGDGVAGLWRPEYRRLAGGGAGDGASGTAGALAVLVTVGDPAASGLDGLTATAWLATGEATGQAGPSAVGERFALELVAGEVVGDVPVWRGALVVTAPGPDRRLFLGVRLVPDGASGPQYLTMGRYLGRDVSVPFVYSVSPAGLAGSGGDGSETGGNSAGAGKPSLAPGEGPAAGSGSATGSGTEGETGPGRAEIVPTPAPPLIEVIMVTKLTTDKREDRTYHARWEWDFGDGERLTDSEASHTTVSVAHTYRTPGTYTVSAVSVANTGRVLRQLTWTVEAGVGPEGLTFTFEAETIVEPTVVLRLEGPKRWVTGKPARFTVRADVSWPPRTRRQVLKAYPGWEFDVVWAKPGFFEVRGALSVKQSYEFPDQDLTIFNTYVTLMQVEVFTPGLTG